MLVVVVDERLAGRHAAHERLPGTSCEGEELLVVGGPGERRRVLILYPLGGVAGRRVRLQRSFRNFDAELRQRLPDRGVEGGEGSLEFPCLGGGVAAEVPHAGVGGGEVGGDVGVC